MDIKYLLALSALLLTGSISAMHQKRLQAPKNLAPMSHMPHVPTNNPPDNDCCSCTAAIVGGFGTLFLTQSIGTTIVQSWLTIPHDQCIADSDVRLAIDMPAIAVGVAAGLKIKSLLNNKTHTD
jgi:hypothetical protein